MKPRRLSPAVDWIVNWPRAVLLPDPTRLLPAIGGHELVDLAQIAVVPGERIWSLYGARDRRVERVGGVRHPERSEEEPDDGVTLSMAYADGLADLTESNGNAALFIHNASMLPVLALNTVLLPVILFRGCGRRRARGTGRSPTPRRLEGLELPAAVWVRNRNVTLASLGLGPQWLGLETRTMRTPLSQVWILNGPGPTRS